MPASAYVLGLLGVSTCPKCRRQFTETGFCPYDGTVLDNGDSRDIPTFDRDMPTLDHDDIAPGPPPRARGRHPRNISSEFSHEETTEGEPVQRAPDFLRRIADELTSEHKRLVGKELDSRYRIEKQIGEGGMGVVYLAHHMIIEKAVALKVLKPEVAADQSVVQRFVQEARAASRIGHPNIIDVTDFGTTSDGMVYQVMEYLEGQTLSAFLKAEEILSIPRALGIVAQVARALDAAHEKGIVHRDLKPENIFLLEREGRTDFVKIVDFGIAKVQPTQEHANEPRLTRVGTVFGTPEYMAPEQAAGRTDVDRRADIYALGIITYEMLVGRVPLRGETTVRTLAMQMLDAPMPIREANPKLVISDDLEAVIMKSLAKETVDRFDSMQQFLEALEDVTSKTELDLPKVLSHERDSAETTSQDDYTIPEAHDHRGLRTTSAAELANRAAVLDDDDQPRKRRGRATDPAFVGKSSSGLPVFDEIEHESTESVARPTRSRTGPIVALAAVVFAGSVAAYALATRDKSSPVVASTPIDASVLLSSDAEPLALIPSIDDGEFHDAQIAVLEPIDAGTTTGTYRPKLPKEPLQIGEREITVVTRPRGADLLIGNSYAGSDGTNIRRKAGTSFTIRCHLKGFRDGRVKVKFDGKQEVYMCKLREDRKNNCDPLLKTPFDKCP